MKEGKRKTKETLLAAGLIIAPDGQADQLKQQTKNDAIA